MTATAKDTKTQEKTISMEELLSKLTEKQILFKVFEAVAGLSALLKQRIETKWDLICVSSDNQAKVSEYINYGFEPIGITVQKRPKVDSKTQAIIIGETEEVNVLWMKKPDYINPIELTDDVSAIKKA